LVLSQQLGTILGVKPGDWLYVDVLEGRRPQRRLQVVKMAKQYLGVSAYISKNALHRMLREGPAVSSAFLRIDPLRADAIYRTLREMPSVAGISVRQSVIDSFYDTMAKSILVFTFINAILGGVVAFGVIYNTVRIALEERNRELASLRVLGYRHSEVSYILLGELAILTLIAIPVGFLFGTLLCQYMVLAMQSDLYRIPLVLEPYTFAMSSLVVLVSTIVSGFTVWQKLYHLDLVSALKIRA
jgi:putative ABC transport system permease protein